MTAYIVRRLLLAVPTVLGLTVVLFIALRVFMPTDVVFLMLGEQGQRDPALREIIEEDLGVNKPLLEQYGLWIGQLVRGELGTSLYSHRTVSSELGDRLLISVELALVGMLVSLLIAVPIGILAAVKQDSWQDYVGRGSAMLADAVPSFWIAVLVITLGSIWFSWAPTLEYRHWHEDPVEHLKGMAIPSLLVALLPLGTLVRLTRSAMLEVVRQDYVRTARAKGLSENVVLVRHCLRNSMLPVVTVVGIAIPNLIAGTVIFEHVFLLPGVGSYLITAVNRLDYPVIQSVNLLFAIMIVGANLLVDLSYAWLDPRIRYGSGKV